MNKSGQSLGLTLISVIFFLIIAFSSVNFIMDIVLDTTADLNCDDAANISDGTKLLCLSTDITVIYFMITILSVILGVITSRLLL
jgi:hypothetical protein